MRKFLWGKRIHLFIWALLIIYLVSANSLYVRFFLKNGKPVAAMPAQPAVTDQIIFELGSLQSIRFGGEDLYELQGFAFITESPHPETQVIQIVLHSTRENLVLKTDLARRPDATKAYPEYAVNLDDSGFRLLLSKNALKGDNYQIGILITDPATSRSFYTLTGSFIERTPNHLRYISGE